MSEGNMDETQEEESMSEGNMDETQEEEEKNYDELLTLKEETDGSLSLSSCGVTYNCQDLFNFMMMKEMRMLKNSSCSIEEKFQEMCPLCPQPKYFQYLSEHLLNSHIVTSKGVRSFLTSVWMLQEEDETHHVCQRCFQVVQDVVEHFRSVHKETPPIEAVKLNSFEAVIKHRVRAKKLREEEEDQEVEEEEEIHECRGSIQEEEERPSRKEEHRTTGARKRKRFFTKDEREALKAFYPRVTKGKKVSLTMVRNVLEAEGNLIRKIQKRVSDEKNELYKKSRIVLTAYYLFVSMQKASN